MQIDIDLSKDRPQPIIYGSPEDWTTNLQILLKWSPFATEAELLQQVITFRKSVCEYLIASLCFLDWCPNVLRFP